MSAPQDYAAGVTTGQITIGATMVVGLTGGIAMNGWMIKQLSGGTLWVIGASMNGITAAVVGYPVDNTNPISLAGPTKYFIAESAGVTSVLSFVKTLNPPSEF
jgi:hypothetical protein